MIKRHSYLLRGALLVLLLPILASCQSFFFEDRTECPSFLVVMLDKTVGVVDGSAPFTVRVIGDEKGYDEQLTGSRDGSPVGLEFPVPKGMASVGAIVGNDNTPVTHGDSRVLVPLGEKADPWYAFTDRVLCVDEDVLEYVVLDKQYADVFLTLKNVGDLPEIELEIVSGWAGMDMMTLSPVAGDFVHVMERGTGDEFRSRLTRQGDTLLHINMWKIDASGAREELISMFPIGELADKQGFDWSKPSLDDLYITIDFARGDFTVSVTPWGEGWERDLES